MTVPAALPSLLVEQVPLDALRPDPANPRRISEAELEALTRSLREWGFVQPLVARRADRTVIGGHQRLVAAARLGLKQVPVIWLDLEPDQARLLDLALNRISGSWDEQLLARLLGELQAEGAVDLTLTGFGEDELANLLRSLDRAGEGASAPRRSTSRRPSPRPRRAPRTQDAARCGRSASIGSWSAMRPTEMTWTGCSAGPGRRWPSPTRPTAWPTATTAPAARPRRRPIANDALDPAAVGGLRAAAWAANLVAAVDGAIYVCMSTKEWPSVAGALAAAGGHWSDTLIWAKDRFVLGRADYQRSTSRSGTAGGRAPPHHWCGDRDQGDVWTIARPAEAPLHPTMKPLALMERAIGNSSRPGDLVLDLFLGSGSTLIAAERTGRVCAGLELDPLYGDVALARWEAFTGRIAERVDG